MKPISRPVPQTWGTPAPAPRRHHRVRLVVFGVICMLIVIVWNSGPIGIGPVVLLHGGADANSIRSGSSEYCLDTLHGSAKAGAQIDLSGCNSTAAQSWRTTATTIQQTGTNNCAAANSNGAVILNPCSEVPDQVWLRVQEGYYNPATDKCLSAEGLGSQVQLASCSNLSSTAETWLPGTAAKEPACGGSEGSAIACEAAKQWDAWDSTGSNHEALLTTYTDGTPYEEWCADFVSYVYQQAGYPFTNGSADGWDENNANTVQYMQFQNGQGFTMHAVGSGYVPQPGDVAFFNYPGGHVEIVVSGGAKPTFVYGDSATVDPSTGNGQMKSNTITEDGQMGSVEYYLTPS